MRHIKPQSALLQTAPMQIGPRAFVGVAAGLGFRLSDPRILVHEATVWEAIKVAPCSAPLPAPTMLKQRAEWLMLGHSVHAEPSARVGETVTWNCSIRLAEISKRLSCAAPLQVSSSGAALARLATDHAQAVRGSDAQNPVGTATAAPPLQQAGMLGVSVSPFAGTGPIGTEWDVRQRWMPRRPGSIEEMVRDGTHMGYPERLDRRYFQVALPNQWSQADAWLTNAEFELLALGPDGTGFQGRLPPVRPRLLYARRNATTFETLVSKLQSVWFLPDHDVGVLWWTGEIDAKYFQSDEVEELLLGFGDAEDPADEPKDAHKQAQGLWAFGQRHKDLEDHDPLLHADTVLMPPRQRGWVWEVILTAADHPRFNLRSKGRALTQERLRIHLENLQQASERLAEAASRQGQLAETQTPAEPWALTRRRLEEFSDAGPQPLVKGQTIQNADLSGLKFSGWTFETVRFVRCKLDHTLWEDCSFTGTSFAQCDFASSRMQGCTLRKGSMRACKLSGSHWDGCRLEGHVFDECDMGRFAAVGGGWQHATLLGCEGPEGTLEGLTIETLACVKSSLPDWRWTALRAAGLDLVQSQLERLALERCTLAKLSVVATVLGASKWSACDVRMGVLSAGSTLEHSALSDCPFESSSWNGLDARGVAVDHCTYIGFTAQRLDAAGSAWTSTVLDEANAMHANFAGAIFDRCSLREALMHGADLTDTRMERCNLVRARTGWALTSVRPAWKANVEAGWLALPSRNP